MTAAEAIKTCFKKYITFRGRASTTEFWWFTALTWGLILLALTGDAYLFYLQFQDQIPLIQTQEQPLDAIEDFARLMVKFQPQLVIFPVLFLGLPAIAVGARRMHDVGNSGWRQVPILTPLVFGTFMTTLAYLMRVMRIFEGNDLLLPCFLTTAGGLALAFSQYDRVGYPGRNYYGPPPPR